MSGSYDDYFIFYLFQMVAFHLNSDYNPPYLFLVINRENHTRLLVLVKSEALSFVQISFKRLTSCNCTFSIPTNRHF